MSDIIQRLNKMQSEFNEDLSSIKTARPAAVQPVADRAEGAPGLISGLAEFGRGALRGAVGIPEMVGKATQFAGRQVGGPEEEEVGATLAGIGERAEEAFPSLLKETKAGLAETDPLSLRGQAFEAGRTAVESLGAAAAGYLIGGPKGAAVGFFGAIPLFAGSQGEETYSRSYEHQIQQGLGKDEAHSEALKAGWINAAIEGGGELLADVVTAGAAKYLPRGIKGGIVKSILDNKGQYWRAVKDIATKVLPAELSTEVGQALGQQYVEAQYAGAELPTIETAQQVVIPTIILSLLAGGGSHFIGGAKRAELARVLADPSVDPRIRQQAADIVEGAVAEEDKEVAKIFKGYADNAIQNGLPVVANEDAFYAEWNAAAEEAAGPAKPEGTLARAAKKADGRMLPLTEDGAQRRVDNAIARGVPAEIIPHPTVEGRFAVRQIPIGLEDTPAGQDFTAALAQQQEQELKVEIQRSEEQEKRGELADKGKERLKTMREEREALIDVTKEVPPSPAMAEAFAAAQEKPEEIIDAKPEKAKETAAEKAVITERAGEEAGVEPAEEVTREPITEERVVEPVVEPEVEPTIVEGKVVPEEVPALLKEQAGFEAEPIPETEEIPALLKEQADVFEPKVVPEIKTEIDAAAHEAATSPKNDLPEPTEKQIEAGTYKKGHIKVQGLDITVENPEGSTRSGKDITGKEWETTLKSHYGYLKRTIGADQENVDVFVGKNPESEQVFVVDQIEPTTGKFDEHKVLVGFDSQEAAEKGYLENYAKGWKGMKNITTMSVDEFKTWLKEGDQNKPIAPIVKEAPKPTKPKEPWELNFSDFGKQKENNPFWDKQYPTTGDAEYLKDTQKYHKEQVKKAISEGKPVPAEVLAAYPDLKPTTKELPTPTKLVEDISTEELAKHTVKVKVGKNIATMQADEAIKEIDSQIAKHEALLRCLAS
jgi:hypothetical protein